MKKFFVCIVAISAIMALSAISASAQAPQAPAKDDTTPAQAPQAAAVQAPQAPQAAPVEQAAKASELSIYGEVQAVNIQAASISVQYYDYDNDEEKTAEVAVDKDSKLENVKSIDEVKKGDWVDVTYTSAGGKNLAKIVSVEKEEPAADENAPVKNTDE